MCGLTERFRYEFGWGSWKILPYLSVVNVIGRENVLFYKRSRVSAEDRTREYIPISGWGRFPYIGIDFRF